jgi:hypothetical protein
MAAASSQLPMSHATKLAAFPLMSLVLGHFTDALWQKAHPKEHNGSHRIQPKIEQIAQPSFIQSDTHPRT